MKQLLFFAALFLLATRCIASAPKDSFSCRDLITINNDKISGAQIVTGKGISVSQHGLTLKMTPFLDADHHMRISLRLLGNDSCVDENAKILLQIENGIKENVTGNQKQNCKGIFMIYSGGVHGNEGLISTLMDNNILSVKLTTRHGDRDFDIKTGTAQYFRAQMKCVVTYKQ